MASNVPGRRAGRGAALAAVVTLAAVGGPFAATAVIIAEQHQQLATAAVVGRAATQPAAVTAGNGRPLSVSSGSTMQTVNTAHGGVGPGSGPSHTFSSGS